MALFENDVVTMEVPDDWVDHSLSVWVEPVQPGKGVPGQITLSRQAASATDTLENRIVLAVRKLMTLPEFQLVEKNPFTLPDETPAMQLLVEWTHPAGKLIELVSLFLRRGTFWTFTATLPSDRLDDLDPLMQTVLQSFTTVEET